jgi:xanthine dehydrogenase accessory factor
LGTGVAHRLQRAGFGVLITEIPQPLAVRRAVSFAEAVYTGTITVEGVTARRISSLAAGPACLAAGEVPVLAAAEAGGLAQWAAPILVDACMKKGPATTDLAEARLVIGLGPGFVAGQNCHAVVETQRGHNLGRVYWQGSAESDTGQPEAVLGLTHGRVLRAPRAGVFMGRKQIGDQVQAGETLALVNGEPVTAQCDGVVRGLLHDGLPVTAGMKIGDIDPRGVREYCFAISDKARAIGGGVLEAVLAGKAWWQEKKL